MRSLIVDDSSISRSILKKILSSYGECEMASSGKEALEAYARSLTENCPYDLITLDITMPDLNGTETLRHIRRIEGEHGIKEKVKIVMVTSHAEKDYVLKAVRLCDGYIAKPFDPDLVSKKVSKLGLPREEGAKPPPPWNPDDIH